jgi:hypothetical protein
MEKGERKMVLNIEYKKGADTKDKMTDMLSSLLMVRSTAFMARKFVETRIELHEGYNDLLIVFETIQSLIEPAMTYFTNEMMTVANQSRLGKSRKTARKKSA